jgi:HEAT repeat protein
LKSKDHAVRIAAAASLGRLGWPAAIAVNDLSILLKDPEVDVRIASTKALGALGPVSKAAVPVLATALTGEADATVRVAIVEALEAIDPGAPPVIDSHLLALRDPNPEVRVAGAHFHAVPADDSVVSSLEKALGDPDEAVRLKVANSLTAAVFKNSTVVPALLKGLGDDTQRKSVLEAMGAYLENDSDSVVFSQVGDNLPVLKSTLGSAIPALRDALTVKDQETRAVVYGLLGRIVSFSGLTSDKGLREAVEPALQAYVRGLEESDPAVRQEVVRCLEQVPIGQKDIVLALQKFLDRSDLPAAERQIAVAALEAKTAAPGSDAAKRSRRSAGPGAGRLRLRD